MADVPEKRRTVRCAVYTRKSTEEGLDQEFNSLQAQREAAEAYIKSQRYLGWTLLPTLYDDGGFTGGNIERPALKRLLEDIEAQHVDCVMVYKVDRLSRSLLDFARLMDQFDQRSVSFVSVIQVYISSTESYVCLADGRKLPFDEYRERSKEVIRKISPVDVQTLLDLWIDKSTRKDLRMELKDYDIHVAAFRKYFDLDADDVDILSKVGFRPSARADADRSGSPLLGC